MLELQHVSVEFASEHSVLAVDDISMQLEKGTRTAIVGETGSGKSVLLLVILRLLPPNAKVRGSMEKKFWKRTGNECMKFGEAKFPISPREAERA